MKCIDCQHVDLQQYPAHAKAGMGRCKLETLPGVFESWRSERECKHFAVADVQIAQKRIEWSKTL